MKKIIFIFLVTLFCVKGFSNTFDNFTVNDNFIEEQHQMLDTKVNKSTFSQKDGKVYTKFRYYSTGPKLLFNDRKGIWGSSIGVGNRVQNNYIGHDFSISEAVIYDKYGSCNDLSFDYSLLYYPFPNVAKEIYFGPAYGLSIFSMPWWDEYMTIPIVNLGGVLGTQYKLKDKVHFIQIKAGYQTLPDILFTGASISYGVSF